MILKVLYDKLKRVSLGGNVNPYYLSLINEIKKQIDENSFQTAYDLIHQELKMPYVPQDALDVLMELEADCQAMIETPVVHPTDDTICQLVYGNALQKEQAVSLLLNRNLRNYHEEVQILLNSDLLDEFKGELIEALMEQKIDDPYTMLKNGLEIIFVPSSILSRDEDAVLNETMELFDQWFSNDNPAFCNFCNRLLEQEILEVRPFDFTEYEAPELAKSIVRLVLEAFGQSDQLAAFIQIHGLQNVADMPLEIERRGENND